MCAQCQMFRLDPMNIPILTLVRPFVVQSLKGTLKEKIKLLKFCKKDFTLDSETLKRRILERRNKSISIEVRCIRLDGRGFVEKKEAGIKLGRDPFEDPRQ